jgi:hypothetical protein
MVAKVKKDVKCAAARQKRAVTVAMWIQKGSKNGEKLTKSNIELK